MIDGRPSNVNILVTHPGDTRPRVTSLPKDDRAEAMWVKDDRAPKSFVVTLEYGYLVSVVLEVGAKNKRAGWAMQCHTV